MSQLFQEFSKTSKEDWVQLIEKELKGADPDLLIKRSEIEEIDLPAYFHQADAIATESDPGMFPFARGVNNRSNEWKIATPFRVSEASNDSILKALMSGTDSIWLIDDTAENIPLESLFQDVQLEYIQLNLQTNSAANALGLLEFAANRNGNVRIITPNTDEWLQLSLHHSGSAFRPFTINAASAHAAGANTSQEIAIALAEGHELLLRLLNAGFGSHSAVRSISFNLGTDARFFFQIAKIRAFRACWSTLIAQYCDSVSATDIHVTASTGFREISLKDPYTNLLRQTTQAMSAILSGVDELAVYPYDFHAEKKDAGFTTRMATNISLLLKDESFLGVVADPGGGAYLVEHLTSKLMEKSWDGFRKIEQNGGLTDQERERLSAEVRQTAEKRVERLISGMDKLIGINIFPNPENVENRWTDLPDGWNGLEMLILENRYTEKK